MAPNDKFVQTTAFQNAQDFKSNCVSSADVFAESSDAPAATVTHK